MIECRSCGGANAETNPVCEYCGQTLDAVAIPPPRLLAQIQGLVPAEPAIAQMLTSARSAPPLMPVVETSPPVDSQPALSPANGDLPAALMVSESPAPAPQPDAITPEPEGERTALPAEIGPGHEPLLADEADIPELAALRPAPLVSALARPSAPSRPSPVRSPDHAVVPDFESTLPFAASPSRPAPKSRPPAGVASATPLPPPVSRAAPASRPDRPVIATSGVKLAAPTAPSTTRPWLLGVMGLIMLAGVLAAYFFTGPEMSVPRRPAVDAAYAAIASLEPGSRVLVVWDYEPTTQGEMRLLALPLLKHLAGVDANLADISLRPFGPAVAADVRSALKDSLGATGLPATATELGFVPGGAAALRNIEIAPIAAAPQAQSAPQQSAASLDMSATDSLAAFSLVIEFSDNLNTSQDWVEQITARHDIPLIVAASGAVAPLLVPYEQTGQIDALLFGYSDAQAYEALAGDTHISAQPQSAQTLTHLILIALVLLALARGLLAPILRPRRQLGPTP